MKWNHINIYAPPNKNKNISEIGYYHGASDNLSKSMDILEQKDKVLIAGFDLDSTLIKTKSGYRFPKDSDDWVWNYDPMIIKQKLMDYQSKGYLIVIITNQAGIKSSKEGFERFAAKIQQLEHDIKESHPKLMFQVLCLNNKDVHRKPYPTVITGYDLNIDRNGSFYCGDAAGRAGDHSSADIKFAFNIGIKFFTPEHFFLKQNNKGNLEYLEIKDDQKNEYQFIPNKVSKPEFILMVGFPGSGKSVIARYIKQALDKYDETTGIGYNVQIISQDDLGSKQRVEKAIERSLSNNRSIIVDNTNIDSESRKSLIKLADSYDYWIRIVHVDTPIDRCRHNNYYRYLKKYERLVDQGLIGPWVEPRVQVTELPRFVPEMVYRIMGKKYVKPKKKDKSVDQLDKTGSGVPYDLEYFNYFF